MEHVLDKPAWGALTSGNKHLANGNEQVKYFDKEVSPFVGLREITADNFKLLHDLIPYDRPVLFVAPVETDIPAPWSVLNVIKGFQMVCDNPAEQEDTSADITLLTNEDITQMLPLAKLTNPGPFASRTIEFGHYHGVFDKEQLVAMAGQRMHTFNYAEISAVCTHPDHIGKGYARQLLLHQINRIRAAGDIPYLHVRYDNDRAVKLYERLGFTTRTNVYFYVLQKTEEA
jgi:ribosomal protein S18 acetylase RimI-like enzyme